MITVFVLDDHTLFIDGLKSLFEEMVGIRILGQASNGLEALQFLEKNEAPNIILTDIRMPIMNGISLTRELKKSYPSIKILAVSMFDQTADVIEMLEAGAHGYVTKNASKKELEEAIHALIKNEYYFGKNLPKDLHQWFEKEHEPKHSLTRREREILRLVAKGRTTLEMAKQLKISKYTIDTHRKNIHKKLGIKSNAGLVRYALDHLF